MDVGYGEEKLCGGDVERQIDGGKCCEEYGLWRTGGEGNEEEEMRPERFELPAFWFEAKRSIQLS